MNSILMYINKKAEEKFNETSILAIFTVFIYFIFLSNLKFSIIFHHLLRNSIFKMIPLILFSKSF